MVVLQSWMLCTSLNICKYCFIVVVRVSRGRIQNGDWVGMPALDEENRLDTVLKVTGRMV